MSPDEAKVIITTSIEKARIFLSQSSEHDKGSDKYKELIKQVIEALKCASSDNVINAIDCQHEEYDNLGDKYFNNNDIISCEDYERKYNWYH